jgi:hypothetical protein
MLAGATTFSVFAKKAAVKDVNVIVAQIGCVVVAFSVVPEGLVGVSVQCMAQRWIGYRQELLCLEDNLFVLDAIYCSHVLVDVFFRFLRI